jgi:excisionase family DNA binding protein
MRDERLLTVKETAQYLGTTPGNVYDWVKNGKGPRYVRMGRSIRYRLSDLEKYVDVRVVEPSSLV